MASTSRFTKAFQHVNVGNAKKGNHPGEARNEKWSKKRFVQKKERDSLRGSRRKHRYSLRP